MPLGTTIQDSQSEKGVRKQNDPADAPISHRADTAASKYTVDYWRDKLFRPTYQRGKESHEVQQWYVQIQFGGRREKVGLGSNNREDCARAAAKFYKRLQAKGWDAARTELSPDRKTKPRILITVGDLIERLRPICGVRLHTFEEYAYPQGQPSAARSRTEASVRTACSEGTAGNGTHSQRARRRRVEAVPQ